MVLRLVFACATILVVALSSAFAGGETEAAEVGEEAVTISIAHWDIDKSITGEEDPVYDKVKADLGIEIEPVAVSWGDYRDKINVWAASDELPDAFSIDVVGTQIYRNWINNGIVKSLPDDMSDYPRVERILAAGDVTAYNVDGKHWFIPRANYPDPNWWANDRGVLVRTDWMESLGFEMPRSTEEFIDLMVALATEDPDGNGVDDTVGLTAHNSGFLRGAFLELAPHAWGGWIKEDGRWVSTAVSQESFEFYSALRELYERGGLDPDFAVLQAEDGINKFGSGRAGAIALQVAAKHWNKPANVWSKLNPNIDFADVTGILYERPDENGDIWRFITASYWSETYINGAAGEEEVTAILSLYDYLMTEEFKTISQWGFQGEDYTVTSEGEKESLLGLKEDGNPVTPADKYPFLYSMSWFSTWGDENQYEWRWIPQKIRDESWEHLQWALDNAEAPEIPWELNAHAPNLPSFQRVNFDGNADMVNFVLSNKSPRDAWQEIVDKYDAQGYQQLEREMNEYAESIGM